MLRQIYKQHLAKAGYSAAKSKRLFTGVQGHLEGELFGAKNLFEFKPYERFSEAILDKERDNVPYQIEEDKNSLKEKLDEHYGDGNNLTMFVSQSVIRMTNCLL